MKDNLKQITVVFLVLFFTSGCSRSYSGFYFSYPAESKPHENNWTYFGKITVWDPFGKKATERAKRKIEIYVYNKNEEKVLYDSIELITASLEKEIIWDKFETLTIKLYERGNEFSSDEYNKKLIKEGKRHLITLKYFWNGNKFIRN